MSSVKIIRTKIVDGNLYSRGGEYIVDSNTELRLKAAGAIGAKSASDASADETATGSDAGASKKTEKKTKP